MPIGSDASASASVASVDAVDVVVATNLVAASFSASAGVVADDIAADDGY